MAAVYSLTNNLRRILLWQHAKGVTEMVTVVDVKAPEELAVLLTVRIVQNVRELEIVRFAEEQESHDLQYHLIFSSKSYNRCYG